MKKMMFVLLLIVSIGFLAAVESAPSSVVGYVKYPCLAGNNLVALPMNAGYVMASDLANAYPGSMDAISYWDASVQDWTAAVDLGGFWDGDYAIGNGSVLMINVLADFNLFSLGSMYPTNAQYTLLMGNNTVMIPLNYSSITMAGEAGVAMGADAVNTWDATVQDWTAAVDLGGFWDGDYAVTIGMPLMANILADTVWPAGPRGKTHTNVLRTANN